MTDIGLLQKIGRWSARHRGPVVVFWVVVLIAAAVGHRALGGVYSDTLTIPGSMAQQGLNVLRAHDPKAGGQGGQIVFVDHKQGGVAAQRSAIESATHDVTSLPHVLSASDPLANVSKDGTTAVSTVNFDLNPQSEGRHYVDEVDRAVAPARAAGVTVDYGGALGQAAAPKATDARSEVIGIVVALIVLLAGFGSVIAAGLPLVSAIIAVFTGISLLGIAASQVSFGTSSPTLATMMGLGVGIDYALFTITRYRQRLIDGESPPDAIARTLAATGPSVLIAATTVIVAMLGLYASGISFIGKLGLAASITVAVAAISSLTLVPALVSLAASGIDRIHVRHPIAEPPSSSAGGGGALHRYTELIARHPWRFAVAGIAVLAILAVPAMSLQLGHIGPGSEPTSFSERRAYDAISEGFGPGANGPLTIVLSKASQNQAQQLQQTLKQTHGVASVDPFKPSPDGAVQVGRVIPTTGPSSQATRNLVAKLQDQTLPKALSGSHATGYVSGSTATTIDFDNAVSSRLPIIVGVVIAAAFLLLLASFSSPLLALEAALLNLLSIGAAWGVIVAVFQWGWGASVLGVSGTVPIESYVPMIIFAIVFGLSMDYEVFLISRIREHWLKTHDNRASVRNGLGQTARVITCAALIMASVFFAFLLSDSVVVKMLALGLGVSVLIDATVIRLMIVPALLLIFGRANWWTPAGGRTSHTDRRAWAFSRRSRSSRPASSPARSTRSSARERC